MPTNDPSRVTIPDGSVGTNQPSSPPLDRVRAGAFSFWRWLTCGHGHHRWQRRVGVDLAYEDQIGEIVVGRYCPRCGTIEVLKTLELKRGFVVRFPYDPDQLDVQVIPE